MSLKDDAKGKDKTKKDAPAPSAGQPPSDLTEEMQEYLQMRKLSGLPTDVDSDQGRAQFIVDYNKWVAAGQPRPKMPDVIPDPAPVKLYRVRHLGKQKMYFFGGDHKFHGKRVERIQQFKDTDDGKGGKIKVPAGFREVVHYDINFDAAKAKALVAQATSQFIEPRCYFVVSGATLRVTLEDFVGDFDAIIRQHKEGKYIA